MIESEHAFRNFVGVLYIFVLLGGKFMNACFSLSLAAQRRIVIPRRDIDDDKTTSMLNAPVTGCSPSIHIGFAIPDVVIRIILILTLASWSVAAQAQSTVVREMSQSELRRSVSAGKSISLKNVFASVAEKVSGAPVDVRAFLVDEVFLPDFAEATERTNRCGCRKCADR